LEVKSHIIAKAFHILTHKKSLKQLFKKYMTDGGRTVKSHFLFEWPLTSTEIQDKGEGNDYVMHSKDI